MNIINQDLIIKDPKSPDSEQYYILKDNTKLNQVIDRLPAGIINKNITGIGATTLEIDSLRHSIIVVPLKSIASSKAKQHSQCKYVGGKTENFKLTSIDEIKKYLNKRNIPNKKFIVVADSLPKLLNVLGDEAYNYFIMIDEIDSFQLDSGYRDSLEDCLDYYKTFPKDQRALVSSTIMEFSDPELNDEKRYFFNYENGKPRKINIYYSENVKGAAFDFIENLYNKHPEDKILIAYNTVDGCKAIATKLVEENNIPSDQIKILCSPKRKDDVTLFFDELENGILKGRINFITSAYFVGVDINESYHSVAICNPEILHTLLSTNRLKQIAGRCREEKGLLSETIFYKTTSLSSDDQIPKEILLEAASKKIKSIECIKGNFIHNEVLTKQILAVRDIIVQKDDILGYSLIRVNIKEDLAISYFNIDACLDTMNTAKVLYNDSVSLKDQLSVESNFVNDYIIESSTTVSTRVSTDKEDKQEQINIAIEAIKNLDTPKDISKLILNSKSSIQTKFYKRYQENYKYYPNNREELLEKLIELSSKNETAYKSFSSSIVFLNDETPFKKCVINEFPFGTAYNSIEIKEKLNRAYSLAGMHVKVDSAEEAVKKLNQFFKTYKDRRNPKGEKPVHKILGFKDLSLEKDKGTKNTKINVIAIPD